MSLYIDIITGYNVQNFDIPYLLNRATALKVPDSFHMWGRIIGLKSKMKDSTFSSSAYGKRENVDTSIAGRVTFDMIAYMRRNHKLSSYRYCVSTKTRISIHHLLAIYHPLMACTNIDKKFIILCLFLYILLY
jgi:DNA polymerase elongation subunit (family B)